MDVGEVHMAGREEKEYGEDTQERRKGCTESEHQHTEEEMLPAAQASSPKRPKELKVEMHG
jgi:hypothetical protein